MKTKLFFQTTALILLAAFIFTWSCKKNSAPSTTPTNPNQPPPVQYVTASVSGRVIDVNQKPVSNATISTAFASTTTDINGLFTISNTQLDKNAGYVFAQKTGYFNGSKTFLLNAGSSNYVEIQLISKSQSGQFNSASGGSVTISNGGSISFPANAINDSATGAAYSGIVTVSAFYLDPSSADFEGIMPGTLLGIATDSSEKALQSFGMMVAELTGSNGQKLQLASGKKATITFPIPSSLTSTAPAIIPLWSFDEQKGLWREQDSATLQGSNYVGTVSHFSFWNCDAPFAVVTFQALIEDKTNSPLSGVKVAIKNAGDTTVLFNYGYTDASGNVSGKIPANKNLEILVYNHCGSLIYTQNFTTTTSDINLGTINADAQSIPVTFSGTVIDCSGTPVTNGNISIFLDGFFTVANINNGTFSVTINRCYSTSTVALITAVDLTNSLIDTLSVNNITSTNINSLQLKPCSQSIQYITYTVDTAHFSFAVPPDSVSDGYKTALSVNAWQKATGYHFGMYTTVNDSSINTPISGGINIPRYADYGPTLSGCKITLTKFSSVGGFISGSFSGTLYDSSYVGSGSSAVPIQGVFNLQRTY